MAAINALLLATGICRAFVLFVDPYNTRRVRISMSNSLCVKTRTYSLNSLYFSEHPISYHTFDMGPRFMQLSNGSIVITIGLLTINTSQFFNLNELKTSQLIIIIYSNE